MRIGIMLRHYDQQEGGVKVYTKKVLRQHPGSVIQLFVPPWPRRASPGPRTVGNDAHSNC
jgi:hypothetical protein